MGKLTDFEKVLTLRPGEDGVNHSSASRRPISWGNDLSTNDATDRCPGGAPGQTLRHPVGDACDWRAAAKRPGPARSSPIPAPTHGLRCRPGAPNRPTPIRFADRTHELDTDWWASAMTHRRTDSRPASGGRGGLADGAGVGVGPRGLARATGPGRRRQGRGQGQGGRDPRVGREDLLDDAVARPDPPLAEAEPARPAAPASSSRASGS